MQEFCLLKDLDFLNKFTIKCVVTHIKCNMCVTTVFIVNIFCLNLLQVNPMDFSCCADWDIVGPGTGKDRNEVLITHSAKLSKFLLAFLLQ